MIISSPSSRSSLVTKSSRITPTPVVLIKMPSPLPFSTTLASPFTIWNYSPCILIFYAYFVSVNHLDKHKYRL
ncbi:hypothetical protein [Francisella orientalis]|uniref:hypothetical protein n=1 Tax=Francisella orientalis TaxID=299583 RepID=UPI001E646851|nr:hypothetical protein [Francisella orientalis]